jgi:AcrR family transcriptional regulator
MTQALRRSSTPPAEVTLEQVIAIGRHRFQACQRVDLREIARAAGIGRTTLHRWVGTRERFLGLVVADLAERAIVAAEAQVPSGLRGVDRIAAVIELYERGVAGSAALRHFVTREPRVAARVLLSQKGDVNQRIEVANQRLLLRHLDAARRPLDPDPALMAHLLVRTADAFFYADLVGMGESDIESTILSVRMLLRAYTAGAPPRSVADGVPARARA